MGRLRHGLRFPGDGLGRGPQSVPAIGLDGALQKLAGAAYGPYLLGVTAAGLIAYGLYCLVDARYRDVSAG